MCVAGPSSALLSLLPIKVCLFQWRYKFQKSIYRKSGVINYLFQRRSILTSSPDSFHAQNASWFHNRRRLMLPFYYVLWDLYVLLCRQPPRELLLISSEGTDSFVFVQLSWRKGRMTQIATYMVLSISLYRSKAPVDYFFYEDMCKPAVVSRPCSQLLTALKSLFCGEEFGTFCREVWVVMADCLFFFLPPNYLLLSTSQL